MRIRTARPDDEAQWRGLWRGYTEFYDTHLPEHVTAATWRRIVAPEPAILCRFAEEQGRLLGFSHSLLHEGTFVQAPICYLEDLFVDPSARTLPTLAHGKRRAAKARSCQSSRVMANQLGKDVH